MNVGGTVARDVAKRHHCGVLATYVQSLKRAKWTVIRELGIQHNYRRINRLCRCLSRGHVLRWSVDAELAFRMLYTLLASPHGSTPHTHC